jgi:hypothetical protein
MITIRYSFPNGTIQSRLNSALPRLGEHVELCEVVYLVVEVRHQLDSDRVLIRLART